MSVKRFPILFALAVSGLTFSGVARADDDDSSYTLEEVQACSADAMRFCRDALPDVHKIESCMVAKKAMLSHACQAQFNKHR